MDVQEWIAETGIRIESIGVPENPHMRAAMPGAAHWAVILTVEGRKPLALYYSKGSGHRRWRKDARLRASGLGIGGLHRLFGDYTPKPGDAVPFGLKGRTVAQANALADLTEPSPPELLEVLECLALDASVLDCATFRDWCDEYGSEGNPADLLDSYNGTRENAGNLRTLVGWEAFDRLRDIEW